jgi:hypothetical protein
VDVEGACVNVEKVCNPCIHIRTPRTSQSGLF